MEKKEKRIKVQTSTFIKALGAASIGNGKGYVLLINPSLKQGDETVQGAVLASSDGECLGRCAFPIKAEGFQEQQLVYPAKSLRDAAMTLSKVTELMVISIKESFLELATENGTSRVRVPLNESDKMFDVPPSEAKGATFVALETAEFVRIVRCGGYAAAKASSEMRAVFFMAQNNQFSVCSYNNLYMGKAVIDVEKSVNMPSAGQWHAVNDSFVRAVAANLTGNMVQIGLTDKYVTISDSDGQIYASRKLVLHISNAAIKILDCEEKEYSGEFHRKDILLGVEVATVGLEKATYFQIETAEDGTLLLMSPNGENKACVVQTKHVDSMENVYLGVEVFKAVLSNLGDTIRYYGINSGTEERKAKVIYFEGETGKVKYRSALARVNKEVTDEAAKKEEKGKGNE